MDSLLFDTDTISEIIKKKHRAIVGHAAKSLQGGGRFAFSVVTEYEILRGLWAKDALVQIQKFEDFCQHADLIRLSSAIAQTAARLHAILRKQGQPISDADLLIAATAADQRRTLVTKNVRHFERIPGLALQDWSR